MGECRVRTNRIVRRPICSSSPRQECFSRQYLAPRRSTRNAAIVRQLRHQDSTPGPPLQAHRGPISIDCESGKKADGKMAASSDFAEDRKEVGGWQQELAERTELTG